MKKQILLILSILVFVNLTIFAQNNAPKTISGGVVNGKAVSLPAPAYPAAAKAVNASGSVNVQVLIDEEGNIVSASAVSGHPLLRAAAESAALRSKFRPTMLQGQPVKVSGIITYVFNLPKPDVEAGGSATAGDVPSNGNSTSTASIADIKANLDFMSFGGMIGLSKKLNSDESLSSVAQTFFATFAKELESTELPEEFGFIKDLASASKEKRAEMINAFDSVLRKTASGDQLWYLNFGEETGELVAESLKRSLSGGTGSSAIKASLAKLKVRLKSAPPDFPKNMRDSLNSAIEFSEQENLADVDILSELDDKIMDIGDILFDDSEDN